MSWKAEVIADSSGQWCSNAHRFETQEEAHVYGKDLASRWTLVIDMRTVQCDDPVTVKIAGGQLVYLNTPVEKTET